MNLPWLSRTRLGGMAEQRWCTQRRACMRHKGRCWKESSEFSRRREVNQQCQDIHLPLLRWDKKWSVSIQSLVWLEHATSCTLMILIESLFEIHWSHFGSDRSIVSITLTQHCHCDFSDCQNWRVHSFQGLWGHRGTANVDKVCNNLAISVSLRNAAEDLLRFDCNDQIFEFMLQRTMEHNKPFDGIPDISFTRSWKEEPSSFRCRNVPKLISNTLTSQAILKQTSLPRQRRQTNKASFKTDSMRGNLVSTYWRFFRRATKRRKASEWVLNLFPWLMVKEFLAWPWVCDMFWCSGYIFSISGYDVYKPSMPSTSKFPENVVCRRMSWFVSLFSLDFSDIN